jgi:hypothetical protein
MGEDVVHATKSILALLLIPSPPCFCAVRVTIAGTAITVAVKPGSKEQPLQVLTFTIGLAHQISETSTISDTIVSASDQHRLDAITHVLQHPDVFCFRKQQQIHDQEQQEHIPEEGSSTYTVTGMPRTFQIRCNAGETDRLQHAAQQLERVALLAACPENLTRCKRCLASLMRPDIVSSVMCDGRALPASVAGLPGACCENGYCDTCRYLCAKRICRWAKRCLSDPACHACIARLQREFALLSSPRH